MGFDDWSTGKKVAIVVIIIAAICCVVAAVSFVYVANDVVSQSKEINVNIGGNNSSANTVDVAKDNYKINIKTNNDWKSYITTDGRYSQDEKSGSSTIDLGNVEDYSSITIDQVGSGDTSISIVDSTGKEVVNKTNSDEYGSIYILLKAS